jgi:CubicO group peptidase (beta-lactamase class C family)
MTFPILLLLAANLADVKSTMQSFVDKGAVAGTVTLVNRNGERMHLEAVGWQDIESRTPMSPSTIFQIMSMTKPVTSIAVAMLAEEGRLTLNDPIARHLPEFRGRKETIRDLLTHTSGMPEYGPAATQDLYLKFNWTLEQAVMLYSQQPPLFKPGEKWQYSNTGMATLGRIVEVVGGMPYEKFCQQRIFDPLGMKDTHFFIPAEKHARVATAYQVVNGKMISSGPYKFRPGSKYSMPEGGLYSTAEDYARFLEALRTGGKPLVSRPMLDAMTAPQLRGVKPAWGKDFGLGFSIDPATEGFGHGGAFGTHGWAERKTGLVRVFMVQKFGASIDDVRNAFFQIVSDSVR